jgi:hypothetical protein
MKKINTTTIGEPDKTSIRTTAKKHSVMLDWDNTVFFTDIKKAKAFIVETNEFLTFKLFELNEIYIDVFTKYRRLWFYLDTREDASMKRLLDNVNENFKLSVDRSHWQNGSVHVYKWINSIAADLKKTLEIIKSSNKRKQLWADIRVAGTLINRIDFILMQLKSWGKS